MSIGNYGRHAEIWDSYAADRSTEAGFWTSLAKRYGVRAICAMCATGSMAAALTNEGLQVTGIDITKEMIETAKSRYADRKNLRFVQADLCELQLSDQNYDFAFVGTTSFHHLQTAEQRQAALRGLYRHTRMGGGLALELWYPGSTSWASPERTFDPLNPPADAKLKVWKKGRTEYDADSLLVSITQEVFMEREGRVESFSHAFALQLLHRDTLVSELDQTGYSLIKEYGDYDFSPWQPGSPKWIIEAVRR